MSVGCGGCIHWHSRLRCLEDWHIRSINKVFYVRTCYARRRAHTHIHTRTTAIAAEKTELFCTSNDGNGDGVRRWYLCVSLSLLLRVYAVQLMWWARGRYVLRQSVEVNWTSKHNEEAYVSERQWEWMNEEPGNWKLIMLYENGRPPYGRCFVGVLVSIASIASPSLLSHITSTSSLITNLIQNLFICRPRTRMFSSIS